MSAALDTRLHAYRPDLADSRLQGRVTSARFVEGSDRRVVGTRAPLRPMARIDGALDSELIRGEIVRVFEDDGEGWSWVQNVDDGYVGYVPRAALGAIDPPATHRIVALRTFVYPGPDMKLPASGWLSLGSRIALGAGEIETRGTVFRPMAGDEGAVVASHVAPLEAPPEPDFVAVAERFVETPYLWGGRTSLGLDCSAFVQISLAAAGIGSLRDTDMQEKTLGHALDGGLDAELARGDLVFWKGHVGILTDARHMVHASGHHMRVVIEPLAEAVARIGRTGLDPTSVRRL